VLSQVLSLVRLVMEGLTKPGLCLLFNLSLRHQSANIMDELYFMKARQRIIDASFAIIFGFYLFYLIEIYLGYRCV